MNRFLLLGAFVIGAALPARAMTLTVTVVDPLTLNMTITGSVIGPASDYNSGILFVDLPISGTFYGNYQSISGNMMLGSNPLHDVYTGYNNYVYAGSLQLRNSLNGTTPLNVGDVVSGSATITFRSGGHGLTQSMFDGQGAPIYWGHHGTPGFTTAEHGTFQGYAISAASAVPDSGSTGLMLATGLAALILLRRRSASPARA